MTTAAERVQAHWDLVLALGPGADGLVTQSAVLALLPGHIRIDFDCVHGPHDWISTGTIQGVTRHFCTHCNQTRRTLCRATRRQFRLYGA